MADETTAMVQMISLTMNGTEKAIRGGAAVIKVMARVLWQIYLKIKQRIDLLPGERTMMRFALDGKTLQCVTMNKDQFELFKKNAKRYNVQYHHVNNKKGKGEDLVTVFVPETDAHKFNHLVNDLKLNSIQNVGTVQAENVHPMKKPDMGTVLAENVDKEGVLDIASVRNNLIRGGMDPDEADVFVSDFLASPEYSAAVDSGKVKNFIVPPMEVSKDMIKELAPSETPATEIADTNPAFSADGISTRDWVSDKPLFEARRESIKSSLAEPQGETVDGFKQAEIDKLDKIIELGDKGELTAIEDSTDLNQVYSSVINTSSDVVSTEVNDVSTATPEGGITSVSETATAEVGESIGTKSIKNIGMEGGHGTTNYASFVEEPSKLGDIVSHGPELGPDIIPPAPNA